MFQCATGNPYGAHAVFVHVASMCSYVSRDTSTSTPRLMKALAKPNLVASEFAKHGKQDGSRQTVEQSTQKDRTRQRRERLGFQLRHQDYGDGETLRNMTAARRVKTALP